MKHLIKSALFLLALIVPATALAHDFEVDGIYYNINGTTATVTYKGTDYSQYSNEYSGSVTIPFTITYNGTTYPVTSIGEWAFFNCEVTEVFLPNSITKIENGAFHDCNYLTKVDIPNSITSIGDFTFEDCRQLTSMNIGDSVSIIGDRAFNHCPNLSIITVNSNNPKYDSRNNCNAIIETSSNTLIAGCKNTIIPNSVTCIGIFAFCESSLLTEIDIPNSVTSIGDAAFYDCTSLTAINLGDSVTSIGENAFSWCTSLSSINIPNSVNYIGNEAFSGTAWLDKQPDGLVYAGLIAYQYKGTMPEGTSITLKDGTKRINDYVFFGCTGLTTINIPNSVTYIGDSAFGSCTGLTTVTITNSVTAIGNLAFNNCSSLTTINIGNSTTSIGSGTFHGCSSLNNVYCYATTPPECIHGYYYSFSNYSATLHVPAASLAAYFTAPEWSKFENIIGDAIETTGISISRDSVEIPLGEQIELTATVTPANASCKEVTWYSTDPSVATVENGVVTAIGYGECDIYAYCMGMPAICHVSVTNRISLEQQEAMLLPNHMLVLNLTAPAMPAGFTVTSSDPTVAAARVMNGKVQIVGIKEGITTITVASSDGTAQPATCLVTVYTELGDGNCDGFLNISDLTLLIDYLMNNETTTIKETNADLNSDGNINIADVTALIDHLLTTTD